MDNLNLLTQNEIEENDWHSMDSIPHPAPNTGCWLYNSN